MDTIFKELGLDYNNRQEYGRILGIIIKDRKDFCQEIWDVAKDCILEHTDVVYRALYKFCLRKWSKANRVFLYKLDDGWGTPPKYDIFKKIEEEFGRRDTQLIVNKIRILEKANIILPYSIPIDTLEFELKQINELENKQEKEGNSNV